MVFINGGKFTVAAVWLHLSILLLIFSQRGDCRQVVKNLPGYSGDLPFKLQTGYISVDGSELFYLFVEAEEKPLLNPLLIHLVGGPGCSALNGFFFQIGPLQFKQTDYPGGLPELIIAPNTWTKTASVIFLDVPVGTGYSYATTEDGYQMDDTLSSSQIDVFLRKWLIDYPEFLKTEFFISTDSYSGVIAPILANDIISSNKAGVQPTINLKGILSGSPHIDTFVENNEVVPYAYRMALISEATYKTAANSCDGNYVDVDSSNAACLEVLEEIELDIEPINYENILDPKCSPPNSHNDQQARRSLRTVSRSFLPSSRKPHDYWCPNFGYVLVDIWANDKMVQKALHVRKGTTTNWARCNRKLTYTANVESALGYYKNFTNTGLQVLLYGGDHEMNIPYIATLELLNSLNLTADWDWRPWYVNGQVAGYTVKYSNYIFRITYATVKGAGQSPTQYKPVECVNMFERWIHYYPL